MHTVTITFDKTMFDHHFQGDISNYLISKSIIHTNRKWVSIFKDGIVEIQSNDVQQIAEVCQLIGIKKTNYLIEQTISR